MATAEGTLLRPLSYSPEAEAEGAISPAPPINKKKACITQTLFLQLKQQ